MDKKIIGERLRIARKAAGLTQEQLAAAVGYSHKSAINKIELGLSGIPSIKLQAIADALGITTSFLTSEMQIADENDWLHELVDAAKKLSVPRRLSLMDYALFLITLEKRERENDILDIAKKSYRMEEITKEPLIMSQTSFIEDPETGVMKQANSFSVTFSNTHVEDTPNSAALNPEKDIVR